MSIGIGLGEVLIIGGNLLCLVVVVLMVVVVLKGRPDQTDDENS